MDFCSVGLVLVVVLFCFCNKISHIFLHPIGQQGVGFCISEGVIELLLSFFRINFTNVDAAVIEVTTPVLLDVCGDDILANIEILGRDVNLYRALAIGPTNILLQKVTIDVCLINIIVTNVQLVRQTFVDLFEFEVTANPVVRAVSS